MRIHIVLICICLAFTNAIDLWAGDDAADTRGPVVNTGMAIKIDEEGVQAPGYVWQRPQAKQSWSAQWIGSTAKGVPDSAANCLRKEVILDQKPKKVTAWITSNNYLLYINGRPAARGPADPGRDFVGASSHRRFYDCRDLTSLFNEGTNVLGVELLGCNDFLFEALIEYPDGKTATIRTDDSWKCMSSGYLKSGEIVIDERHMVAKGKRPLFDAAAEPIGWLVAGFNDSNWPACKIIEPPPEQLVLSELPPLMEARYPYFDISGVAGAVKVPDKPFQNGHSIFVNGDGEFAVHYAKIMSGRCGIKVKGSKGTRIYLASNETNSWGGRIYEIVLRDGIQSFESRDYYALGTINVVVRDATGPVEIMDVSADFMSQPVEYQGSFSCSDADLNKLWKSCRWSTQICMITHHLDSPQHQEPISDYGDYLIADLVNYYAMGNNPWLARQDLRKWAWVMEDAKYQTFHTSYMFYWLQSLVNYYEFTGDKSVVDELAPNVHAVIDRFTTYIGKNGIISEAPNYMFMDWVTVTDDKDPKIGFACHHPPAVIGQGYMTALFYRGLADAELISKLTNDETHFQRYENLRRQIEIAYERELWNPDKGLYRDGKPFVTSVAPGKWLPADKQMESFSVQNNSIAVLHDLAPAARQESLVDKMMLKNPWNVTPYYMHFVLDSIAHAGLFGKYGVPEMHTWHIVPETQTVQEMGTGRGDYSHGWIATPTYQMSSKILGVSPTSPGFDTVAIRPTLCDLDFANGTVPSPHGSIDVGWRRAGEQLTVKVTIPTGVRATVALPVGGATTVQVLANGKTIWSEERAGEAIPGLAKIRRVGPAVEAEVMSGMYQFECSGLTRKSSP